MDSDGYSLSVCGKRRSVQEAAERAVSESVNVRIGGCSLSGCGDRRSKLSASQSRSVSMDSPPGCKQWRSGLLASQPISISVDAHLLGTRSSGAGGQDALSGCKKQGSGRSAWEQVISKVVEIDLGGYAHPVGKKRGKGWSATAERAVSESVEVGLCGDSPPGRWVREAAERVVSELVRIHFNGTHSLVGERAVSESLEIELSEYSLSGCEERGYSQPWGKKWGRGESASQLRAMSTVTQVLTSWVREVVKRVVSWVREAAERAVMREEAQQEVSKSAEIDLEAHSPTGHGQRRSRQSVSQSRSMSAGTHYLGVNSSEAENQKISRDRTRWALTSCVREATEQAVSKSVEINLKGHSPTGCEQQRSKQSVSQSKSILLGTHSLGARSSEKAVSESREADLGGHSLPAVKEQCDGDFAWIFCSYLFSRPVPSVARLEGVGDSEAKR
ncbi:hypothetical protein BJ138DRAFT_1106341 [Hygrophoropsis aurantiaca]|uniref:Uncharacterized protein n=1 Tax=Hygrophoropsis aurantiaca TaxID=72124 RepID=A0ACB7ZW50_9AGAM|nr:hypothetical protein BJ138DRAFT_1106341 [Hygrophoropsis aurantiaca]